MDLPSIAAGCGICVALIGGNAWVMKLVIENAVLRAIKRISEDYVSKDDFDRHIEQCPANRKSA